ncbi:MAG: hypothetical protein J6L24_04410 [Oscillospiraceae bacterium]|nr:hypothetical protein [Oscillospiraceae bacterium]
MSDQELLDRITQGDQAALTELCDSHAELIRKRAQWIARQYNCLRSSNRGGWSDYTKETLSELESVGMLALIECARNGGYDSSKGTFGTYIVPFLDGAMRRHLEASMGTLSLDRDSMGLVRKAQMLYHRDGKEMNDIAEELDISCSKAARAVAYPTHFFSVYDLPTPEGDGDIFEYLMSDRLSASAEEIALRALTMESLHEQFQSMSKREQDILGRSFGVFGYTKTDLREIAVRNRLREDGVEKAKKQALKKLRGRCLNSMAWKFRRARWLVNRAISQEWLYCVE